MAEQCSLWVGEGLKDGILELLCGGKYRVQIAPLSTFQFELGDFIDMAVHNWGKGCRQANL